MGKREVKVVISGDSSGGQAALRKLDDSGTRSAAHAETVGTKIGGAFSKAGSKIGGEFGEVLSLAGEGLENLGEHGLNMGKKLAAGGAAVTTIGASLTMFGSSRKQAEEQLKAAIEASGNEYSEYRKQIEETIKTQEKFGHGEGDTQEALMKLTAATQDPKKALADMGLVANLAASQHESLADAASQVARVYGGSGKVLKQYGLTMDSAKAQTAALKTATSQHAAAITNLALAQKKLSDLEAVDASKAKLSVANQIALRNAHQAVADAIKQHGEKSTQAQAAEQKLRDEEAKLTAGSQLSTAQQIALRDAHDKVAKAAADLKLKTENLAKAQDGNKTSTQDADKALGLLGKRLDGQASASVDSWGGKLRVARAELADWTAGFGQKFGPAITATGPVLMTAGLALDLYKGHLEKVALSQAAMGVEAETAAAEVAVADGEMVAASEAAGAASTIALGPIGIAIGGVVAIAAIATRGFGLFGRGANDQVKPVQALTDAILADGDALGKMTTAQVNNTLESKGAYDQGLKLGISQNVLLAATMGNIPAQKQLAAAVKAARDAYDANNKTVTQAGEKGRVYTHTVNTSTQAQKDAKAAADKLAGSQGVVAGQLAASAHAADNETKALKGIPKVVSSSITLDLRNKKQVEADLAFIARDRHSLLIIDQITGNNQGTKNQTGHAAGTPHAPAGLAWVGEEGPELMNFRGGEQVIPHAQSMAMAASHATSGGVGGDQTLVINLYLGPEKVHQSLLKLRRDRGGISLGYDS
jgi:hypothetical protein